MPVHEYERRLTLRRERLAAERARSAQIGNARLALFALGILATWFSAAHGGGIAIPGLITLAVLVALFVAGDRFERRIRFARRGAEYYERALDRVRLRRNEKGETGERFLDPEHPYAFDLDLFGRNSLFQFLSVCRTGAGEQRLADWLLHPASPSEIAARHGAITELRPLLDLRESMAVLGTDFGSAGHPDALRSWAAAPPIAIPASLRIAARVLSSLALGLLVWWLVTLVTGGVAVPRIALICVGLLEAALFFRWRPVVSRIAGECEQSAAGLALLRDALARVESESFASPRLKSLHNAITSGGKGSASQAIAQLNRLMQMLESRDNWALRLFGPLVLWTTQVSFAVETWRQQHSAQVPAWINALADFEALSSLASAYYEHPEDTLPEIAEGPACFRASALGHPLLLEGVPNDISLGSRPGESAILIVSGSNMSGKSTLLRTVGTNTVLALAGAPVRAASLSLPVLNLGASIRTNDSLADGISRFYAEILRIRQILQLPQPSLCLLDELLAGTNSHDRRIGAEAILRGLAERGAMALATTHDLALAAIADTIPSARNVHFEDTIHEGRIAFDYKMREGVVTRSNAIALMRSVGLIV
ncbi:MutS-related protein [Nevskia soli]|uniref:MutS-related protein n=1 Tax=Nevskia soli TaxID=418856 RepID=UPI0015D8774F|nr:DNA mismatch repair protein MutS [Nevskia soli]